MNASKDVDESKQISVSLPGKEPFTITILPTDILSEIMISNMGTLCYTICAIPYVILDGSRVPLFPHELIKDPINKQQLRGRTVYDTISGMGVYWT